MNGGWARCEKAIERGDKKRGPGRGDESIDGLRLGARQKLDRTRPERLGQGGCISGVSPADVAVLMVYLSSKKKI